MNMNLLNLYGKYTQTSLQKRERTAFYSSLTGNNNIIITTT